MRHDLADDPAVIQLAEETECVDELHVIGVLHKLWSWADRQSRSGNALGVTEKWLSRFLVVPGFTDCLQRVGWLRVTSNGIQLPRFRRHSSESAKKRALAALRQAKHRSRNSNAEGVTRGEKRREDTSLDRSIDRFDRIDDAVWKNAQAKFKILRDEIREKWPAFLGQGQVPPVMRDRLAKACVCVELGALPASWVEGAVAKMIQCRPNKNPGAWLGKTLAADAAELGHDFDAYQRAITLPKKDGE